MAFDWDDNWNGKDNGFPNNNGATKEQILAILSKANKLGTGDQGLRNALSAQSASIKIMKGIHQETKNNFPHITVGYVGGMWHVNLVATNGVPPAAFRVGQVVQWKN